MRKSQNQRGSGSPILSIWAAAVAPLSLALGVLLAAAPGAQAAASVAALIPVLVVFYWSTSPQGLAAWMAFLAGLVLDCVSHGPIGAWALVYLLAGALASAAWEHARGGAFLHWGLLIAGLAALAGVQCAIGWIFDAELPGIANLAWGIGQAALVYPVLAVVLQAATPLRHERATLAGGRRST